MLAFLANRVNYQKGGGERADGFTAEYKQDGTSVDCTFR
jgi:hypothetical protein